MTAPFYATGAFGEQTGFVIIFFVGLAFGFFLERAGFASARKLSAVFYFRDFAVIRMMFTALVTAMLGLLYLSAMGWIQMDGVNMETTFLGAQIVGGLLLGMGFVMGGYCPGTSVVAAASGKLDGLVFIAGLLLGNAVFGFGFDVLLPLYNSGSRGVYSLSDWLGADPGAVGFVVVLIALGAFAATELADRKKENRVPSTSKGKGPGEIMLHITWQRTGAAVLFLSAFVLLVGRSMAGGNQPAALSKMLADGKDLMEPVELAAWIDQKKPIMLIDLRDPAAFSQYHISGANNIGIDKLANIEIPKDKPVVLCSTDGARAGQAWAVLASRGVSARILKGGLREWWLQVATPADLRNGGGIANVAVGLPAVTGTTRQSAPAAPAPAPAAVGTKFKKGASCL